MIGSPSSPVHSVRARRLILTSALHPQEYKDLKSFSLRPFLSSFLLSSCIHHLISNRDHSQPTLLHFFHASPSCITNHHRCLSLCTFAALLALPPSPSSFSPTPFSLLLPLARGRISGRSDAPYTYASPTTRYVIYIGACFSSHPLLFHYFLSVCFVCAVCVYRLCCRSFFHCGRKVLPLGRFFALHVPHPHLPSGFSLSAVTCSPPLPSLSVAFHAHRLPLLILVLVFCL